MLEPFYSVSLQLSNKIKWIRKVSTNWTRRGRFLDARLPSPVSSTPKSPSASTNSSDFSTITTPERTKKISLVLLPPRRQVYHWQHVLDHQRRPLLPRDCWSRNLEDCSLQEKGSAQERLLPAHQGLPRGREIHTPRPQISLATDPLPQSRDYPRNPAASRPGLPRKRTTPSLERDLPTLGLFSAASRQGQRGVQQAIEKSWYSLRPSLKTVRLWAPREGSIHPVIQVIDSSIEKASLKEKEPRCDFCFLREKDVIKCAVGLILYRTANFTPTPPAFPALPKTQEPLTSSVMDASWPYHPTPSASSVLSKAATSYNWPAMHLSWYTVTLP